MQLVNSFEESLQHECEMMYTDQRSTEGRRSTAVAEGFSPTATASAAEGLKGRRPKFRPKAKNFQKLVQKSSKVELKN